MSGLAAGIRLAMFDKRVLILEHHSVAGGLNSYYQRGKRQFDVGLHAMTNFAAKGERSSVLGKVLKQLRIPYDDWQLVPQKYSLIHFPFGQLTFDNDPQATCLLDSVSSLFSASEDVDDLRRLITWVKEFPDAELLGEFQSARAFLKQRMKNPRLIEMLLAPLLIYGSAWERDMDLAQMVIMFRSIYLEGFCRPEGGVRRVINSLQKHYKERGGELRFNCGVQKIICEKGRASGVLTEKGEFIGATSILSSAGYPETQALCGQNVPGTFTGQLSFVESLLVSSAPKTVDASIIFANFADEYHYECPKEPFDQRSAVICFPEPFGLLPGEELVRITLMANYSWWSRASKEDYLRQKESVYQTSLQMVQRFSAPLAITFKDIFTPRTITRYTRRLGGAVYGSPQKIKSGRFPQLKNLYLIGTDQGYLGITGSMLSGISVTNHELL